MAPGTALGRPKPLSAGRHEITPGVTGVAPALAVIRMSRRPRILRTEMEWHVSVCWAESGERRQQAVLDSSLPDPARIRAPHGLLIHGQTPARRTTLFSSIEQLFEILGRKY
jgi:hypothetical protein